MCPAPALPKIQPHKLLYKGLTFVMSLIFNTFLDWTISSKMLPVTYKMKVTKMQ